jgi:hypothetical protein
MRQAVNYEQSRKASWRAEIFPDRQQTSYFDALLAR